MKQILKLSSNNNTSSNNQQQQQSQNNKDSKKVTITIEKTENEDKKKDGLYYFDQFKKQIAKYNLKDLRGYNNSSNSNDDHHDAGSLWFNVEFKGKLNGSLSHSYYYSFFETLVDEIQKPENKLFTNTLNCRIYIYLLLFIILVDNLYIPSLNTELVIPIPFKYIVKDQSLNENNNYICCSNQVSSYFILGIIIGIAIRTNISLPLKFPTIIWKMIVKEPLHFSDIKEIDEECYEMIKELEKIDEKDFNSKFKSKKFVYYSLDNEKIELIENGSEKELKYENKNEYINLIKKDRLTELKIPTNEIREGLISIIPEIILDMLTSDDLQVFFYIILIFLIESCMFQTSR